MEKMKVEESKIVKGGPSRSPLRKWWDGEDEGGRNKIVEGGPSTPPLRKMSSSRPLKTMGFE
jgi:hypothetical protein